MNNLSSNIQLEAYDINRLVAVLVTTPFVFSFLDEDIADFLEDEGYFSLSEFAVTQFGLDTLAIVK